MRAAAARRNIGPRLCRLNPSCATMRSCSSGLGSSSLGSLASSSSMSFLEILPENAPGLMQLTLRRAGLDAGDLADLLVRVAVNLVQHEHLARGRRNRRNRAFDIDR